VQDDYEKRKTADMKRALADNVQSLRQFIRGPLNNPNPLIAPAEYYVASYKPILGYLQSNVSRTILLKEFEQFRPQLLEIVDTWRKEADEYLVNLVPQPSSKKTKGRSNKGNETAVANPLELAATFFKCRWCTEPITYPRILAHRCLLRFRNHYGAPKNQGMNFQGDAARVIDDEDSEESEDIKPGAPREPRAPKEISADVAWVSLLETQSTGMKAGNTYVTFNEEAHSVARNIIQICGEDPGTVTQTKMHKKNARLRCSCKAVMNWIRAVR